MIPGIKAAALVLKENGIEDVRICLTPSKHCGIYDSAKKMIYLDVESSMHAGSLTGLATAVHESMHAVQHHEKYWLFILCSVVPIPWLKYFLECNASDRSIRWMKKYLENNIEISYVLQFYRKNSLSYLPWAIRKMVQ